MLDFFCKIKTISDVILLWKKKIKKTVRKQSILGSWEREREKKNRFRTHNNRLCRHCYIHENNLPYDNIFFTQNIPIYLCHHEVISNYFVFEVIVIEKWNYIQMAPDIIGGTNLNMVMYVILLKVFFLLSFLFPFHDITVI